MTPRSTDDIRQAYLDFFESNGHAVIPGARLIPENDPTVLFTTAGMHPLVPYLLGESHPAGRRLVDVQRCIRTQDIDEVGDSSHLTMFEMLGRWSLGDYFKEGAITMSFEFITNVLEIPMEKFGVSCFGGDDRFPEVPRDEDAAKIWESLGIAKSRIGFIKGGMLESKHNWWGPAGKTGPCGPDSEMFYWIGPTELPPEGSNPATDEKNWLEIGNDVFMQYDKKEDGTFTPLQQQNVDTGMGLDRIVQVMQKVDSVYETDRMQPIMDKVKSLCVMVSSDACLPAGRNHDTMRHQRIIVDHLKAATFIIGDGIKPANVDQGYVLRRIIRRAIRSARQLGIPFEGGFTPVIVEAVIAQYGHVYGHLKKQEKEIRDVVSHEEQQFLATLQEGMKQFTKVMGAAGSRIEGSDAFHLYDTYGFPLELTKEIAAEHGYAVDEEGFSAAFKAHQDLSRKGAEQKFAGGLADHSSETTKLHTATHLLNAALHTVLGNHIEQRGSNITKERLRFDFCHGEKMTPAQIAKVEELVNDAIKADLEITYHVTTPEKAQEEDAIGVFGERYGSEVKVYVIGKKGTAFSKEICGGPHVSSTGMLGSFKIQKEESSSSGVRRIKATIAGGPEEITVAGKSSG